MTAQAAKAKPNTTDATGRGMWDPIPLQTAAQGTERLERIPLEEIHESALNPRQQFDATALEQLMDSLLQTGQLTPVVVRPRPEGGYELGAGHRRQTKSEMLITEIADRVGTTPANLSERAKRCGWGPRPKKDAAKAATKKCKACGSTVGADRESCPACGIPA